jgi:hypothetical protein
MPRLETIYTPKQREALAFAYLDRHIRPAERVVELAAAGQLELDGEQLAPFAVAPSSVRDCASKVRRRRAGELKSTTAMQHPRDAAHALQRRLFSVADQELAVEEAKRRGRRDPERLRQIARAVREAVAIPAPGDTPPVAPGQKRPGTQTTEGGATRGGLAGAILASSARVETRDPRPATDTPDHKQTDGDNAPPSAATPEQQHQPSDAPGDWVREQVGAERA